MTLPRSRRPLAQAPDLRQERALARQGYVRVAGIDEAGRGAWAGPVTAAAVILPCGVGLRAMPQLRQVRDSKMLSPARREALYPFICQAAIAWGVGQASHIEIDCLGIVPATRLAMLRAVQALDVQPDALLIDALRLPDSPLPQKVLYHADALCLSVAAASILAKVTRDRLMVELDGEYPQYNLRQHKGYGSRAHREALYAFGISPIHRQTFRPMTEWAMASSNPFSGTNVVPAD